MRILEINIQNFRKLLQCHIEFSEKTTLFVGANNSGKTSAMDALGKFLADRNFTFNDITISERSAINVIGERWIQKDCEEPTTITEWESLMPKMDIWLNVASNEMHYVACIIPTLKWRGGKLGVRLAFFPKDIVKLFTDYRDAYFAAREVEKAKENVEIRLYPINLSEFLEKNLNTYFSIKTYILDEAKEEQGNPQETPFEMECFIDNPLKKIIKVDMIDAQRGFTDPDKCIPDNWVKPVKIMNHRSAKRIVTLANSIRSSVDDQKQQARSDAEEGTVRLFITSKSNNKEYVEKRVAEMMVQDTGDIGWNDEEDYKSLILEHHMAASRFGFSELYMPLSNSKKFDTSLREGSIPELSILSKLVFPLLVAYQSGNDFEVAKIIRKNSPLLNKEVFITGLNNQVELLRKAEEAVELLMKLWNDGKVPTCLEVLKSIRDTGLFKVGNRVDEVLADYSQDENEKITALRTALSAPFYELERYALYVSDNTRFATHQGVKGLEFPRVMVILDDAQARGFLFSYEKLFGVKAQSDTDEKNAHDGKDTSITRTARLFYVACTRAKKSLAIVAYTENEEMVRDTALANGWFLENEIYIV